MTNNMKIRNKKGFTLVETLIAVFILSVSIAGPLTIASRALLSANTARNQITAFYLAQDALEYVRVKRDNACLANGSPCSQGAWLAALSACTGANGCYIDSLENAPAAPTACPSGGCIQATFPTSWFLYYDTTNSRFCNINASTCIAGATVTKSQFARSVKIAPVGSQTTEEKVTVQVSWADSGTTRSVTIVENLFNWQ
jgi:prepilin-type N-terminal cleavage/methylation domain-containing protein